MTPNDWQQALREMVLDELNFHGTVLLALSGLLGAAIAFTVGRLSADESRPHRALLVWHLLYLLPATILAHGWASLISARQDWLESMLRDVERDYLSGFLDRVSGQEYWSVASAASLLVVFVVLLLLGHRRTQTVRPSSPTPETAPSPGDAADAAPTTGVAPGTPPTPGPATQE